MKRDEIEYFLLNSETTSRGGLDVIMQPVYQIYKTCL